MIITPISGINLSDELTKTTKAQSSADVFVSFKEVLNNAVNNVNSTDAVTKQDAIKVASGQADDLHTIMIDAAKADLALQTLVQVRNKALEAYSEIMRITL
jgi:flagellar hook-basal body complex protein FliE